MPEEDTTERPSLVEIDVSNIQSIAELHELLQVTLGFPEFYGRNWNAFWDAITGLVEMPRRLIVYGWANVSTRWPDDADTMAECLRDMNDLYPLLACDYELRWSR